MLRRSAGLVAIVLASAPAAALADDPPPPLAIHGFGDFKLSNDYLTPRGLLVTNKGVTMQVLAGLVFDVYQNPGATISDLSLVAGIWNDIDTDQHAGDVGSWNEFDWFAGFNLTLAQDWTAGVQYVQFISPPGNFNDEQNIEFSLKYDDHLAPIKLNPYIKLFYAVSGDSTVITGSKGGTFDVEIGAAPTYSVELGAQPVTFSAPTWITVGPSDFWGGTDNWGVFTTGIEARTPLSFIPPQLGHWQLHAGVQYYNMLNDRLILAQHLAGTTPADGEGHRNEFVYSVGFGFGF